MFCVPSRHKSEDKGRLFVYKSGYQIRTCVGHKIRHYVNVERADLDDYKRVGFIGVPKTVNCDRG